MSEGLHSLQCYCPRLRHPEVINGLWGLPSRTPPRQKNTWLEKRHAARVFHIRAAFTAENAPASQQGGRGEGDGGAGWGVHLPTPTCGLPQPRRQRERAGGCRRASPGAHEVAAGEVPAPFVAQLFPQHWSRRVQCRKPPPPSPQPFCHCRGILQILFVTPVTFLPWQQGRGAPTGEASRRAQPPAASTAALSSAALRRTESTHSQGCGAAQETSLRDTLNAHGERVPLFGSPFHQSQPGRKGRRVKCRHFWPCPPVQVVHSP